MSARQSARTLLTFSSSGRSANRTSITWTRSRLGGSDVAGQSYRADTLRGRGPADGAASRVHQEDTADTESRYQVGGETLQGVATWRNVTRALGLARLGG